MDQFKHYERRLNNELNKFPILNQLERQSQIPKSYLVLGVAGVYLLLVYFNVGGIGQFFANSAAVFIPGYYSLVALETPGTSDDTHYLTYWVVYASFSVLEFWSSVIVYWIPAYWLFKTIFFLWLGLPQFSGARYVYATIIKPVAQKFLCIRPIPSSSLNDTSETISQTARKAQI